MIRHILIPLLAMITLTCSAQEPKEYFDSRGYKNAVYFNPIIILGFVNPALEFGYVRNFENAMSTKFSASYIFPESLVNNAGTIPRDTKGYRLSLEQRFYTERSQDKDEYFGLEFAYLQRENSVLFRFNPAEPYDSIYYQSGYSDTVRVHRKTYSFNVNFGKQYFYNRAYLELLFGFGLRYKEIHHRDRINPEDPIEPSKDFNLSYSSNREKKSWGLSLPLAIRIGYIF